MIIMRVTNMKLPCLNYCKVLPLTPKLECYYDVSVPYVMKSVETLNNLCERKIRNICNVSYKSRRCCFISTRNRALDSLFFITSIMMLTELLVQTNSLRKCVLCEFISYVSNI